MAEINDTAERWLPIPGWEGRYEVSDMGRVRGLPRIVPTSGGRVRRHDPRVLRASSTKGYQSVHLSEKPHRVCTLYVHRLVVEAFVGPIPAGFDVDHLDYDRSNNRLANLRVVPHSENVGRSRRYGRMPRGETHGIAKLTEDDVRQIRVIYAAGGISQAALGRRYGVTQSAVKDIVRRINWPHVV